MEKLMEEKKTTLWQEIKICRVDETNYPHDLKKIKDRPEVLYYRGNIDILNEHKSIAVVGSRKISAVGAKLAYNAGSIIGKNGFNLVNGLALGCDAEALKGALAAGGKCAVVLPCGINEIYPKSNQWIAEEVLKQGGCLISEYPEGTSFRAARPTSKWHVSGGSGSRSYGKKWYYAYCRVCKKTESPPGLLLSRFVEIFYRK